jgi:hypothetical protein
VDGVELMAYQPIATSKYQVQRQIGDSFHGPIYLATDIERSVDVAIKVLDKNRLGSPDIANGFYTTAKLFSSFNHPGIVKVLGLIETGGESAIVMEFCAGSSLSSFLASNQTRSHRYSLSLLQQVADALDYIHSQSYAYRDFSADNVFFSGNTNIDVLKLPVDDLVPSEERISNDILANQIVFAELAYQMLVGKSYPGKQRENWVPAKPSEVNVLLPPAIDEILIEAVKQTLKENFSCIKLVSALKNAHPFSDDGNYLLTSSQSVTDPSGGLGTPVQTTAQTQELESDTTSASEPNIFEGTESPDIRFESWENSGSTQPVNLHPEEKDPFVQFVETNRRLASVTDHPTGPDKLNFKKYADAFADLITNPDVNTPLTVGIFGEWGSGKSFLMGKIKEEVLAQQKKIKKPVKW